MEPTLLPPKCYNGYGDTYVLMVCRMLEPFSGFKCKGFFQLQESSCICICQLLVLLLTVWDDLGTCCAG